MATEYRLSYTASEIDERLAKAGKAVSYDIQTLTDEEKAQARENIGVMSTVTGELGQVLSFDSDGNPAPMTLFKDVTETQTIPGNLFNASAGYTEGYTSPNGPIDLETLEVPLDNPVTNGNPTAYKLHNALIHLEPNTTYAFSKFTGNATLFDGQAGTKHSFLTPGGSNLTQGDNCYLYTTGTASAGYYLAIHLHIASQTPYENMVIVKGDTLPTKTTVLKGTYLHNNIKVKAEQVEGLEEMIPEGSTSDQIVETKTGTILTLNTDSSSNIEVRVQKDDVSDYSGVNLNVVGANLLKFPYWYMYNNWTEQGVSFTVDTVTGKIHASGTATADGSIKLWRSTDNFTLPKGIYKLSHIHEGEADIAKIYFAINVYVNGSFVRAYSTDEEQYTIMDLSEYDNPILEPRILFKTGVTFDDDIYPMINVGDTALPWEAYIAPTTYSVESDGTANIQTITPYTTIYADDMSYTVSTDIVVSDGLADRVEALEDDLRTIGSWIGKKWCACGDSITYPYEGTTRYYDLAHEEYGIEVVTEAVGGSGYFAAGTNALINRIENVPNDADVITILCGINDVAAIASGKLAIGEITDSAESTFCGCVNSTLNKLFVKNVDANVGIISPIITISGDTYPTETQVAVNKALREICEYRSIPFLDLYHGSGMRPDEEAFRNKYYSSHDGLHPNTLGHARIYPRILHFVKTLLHPNSVDFRVSGGNSRAITKLEPLTINGVTYDGTEPIEVTIAPGGGTIDVKGTLGQVVGFDADGNLAPMPLLEDITETETIEGNLFDASVGYTAGYASPTGPINLNTLEVPLDTPDSAFNLLHNALIYLEPNTTYAISKFTGRITSFTVKTGMRSAYYVPPSTNLTEGDNCYLLTTLDRAYGFYIAISIHATSPTAYKDMIIVKGDSIPTETTTVVVGTRLNENIKVKAEQVEGLEEMIPESSGSNDATSASSDFDTLYAVARKIQNYQSPTTLTCSLMSDTHYEDSRNNAEKSLVTARTMGLMESYMKQDFIGNLGDMIPGNVEVETSRKYLSKLAQATNQNAKCPVFYARGNHDDNGWYSGGGMGGTYQTDEILNDKEWYQAIFGISAKDLVIDENRPNGGYGYFDHEASKIRVFILNTEDLPYIVEDDGTYRYSSYNNGHAFSNEQINFVANALYFADKGEPNEWAALFMSHVPLDTTNADGYRFGIKDALIRGHEYLLAVISAYRKGAAFSASGSGYNSSLGDVSEDFNISVDVDYTEKGGGDVIAFVSGHTHTDNFSSLVGIEGSLSRGYAYIGLMGSTSFANFIFDRANNRICAVKYGTSSPDLTEGAAVEAPDTGSIESGEWTVNIAQFRPNGANLYNGLSETHTGAGGIASATKIDKSTLEVDAIANNSGYLISKAIAVKPFTRYAIPSDWNGVLLALGHSGGRSSFITPISANGYKYFQTGIRQYYVVFDHHVGSYTDYANFWIKEMGEGIEYA